MDSGDERFPASTLDFIGRAVASVLSHPEETANKYLLVASFNPSRNEILSILEELTGGAKWEVKREDSKSLRKLADEKFAAGEVGTAFPLFLNVYLFADGAGTALTEETSANKLLGVEGEDLRDVLRKWLVGAGVISS